MTIRYQCPFCRQQRVKKLALNMYECPDCNRKTTYAKKIREGEK
jgi:ribosomal protein L37AE/L43A